MLKYLLMGFIFFGVAVQAKAQVSAVTVNGPVSACSSIGNSISVTFTVTQAADFNPVQYDILFSAATTASSAAYSSFRNGMMDCANDTGWFYNNSGNTTNTITRSVAVPSGFSGYIIVLAQSNVVRLSCSNPQGNMVFTNPCANTFTPTNTPTFTPTNTLTFTRTFTPTFTNTPTGSATYTPTFTNTGTNTFTSTKTNTPTKTFTPTFTNTFTPTPTFTFTNVNTFTPTITPTSAVNILRNQADGSANPMYDAQPSLTPTVGTGKVDDARLNDSIGKLAKAQLTLTATWQPTSTPTGTLTPTATPTSVAASRNSGGWNGPSPQDDDVSQTGTAFNANSTPIAQSTPKANGFTDGFGVVSNIGAASGQAVYYVGSRAVTFPLCPGCFKNFYVQDTAGNVPVSIGGDSTASVTIQWSNLYFRRR